MALLWHAFGHDNLGVDALSRGDALVIEAAAKRAGAEVEFVTLGSRQAPNVGDLPANVTFGPGIRVKQMLRGRSEFLAAIDGCDLVVDIGEGDSFTDIYGMERMLYEVGSKFAVVFRGKPLVLAPQTIGPFRRTISRILARAAIDRCCAAFARDHLSATHLAQLEVKAPTGEFIDVAFGLPFEPRPKADGAVRVGVNVSGLLYNNAVTGKNVFGLTLDYAEVNRRIIRELSKRSGVEISLFSHVAGGGGEDDDGVVMDAVVRSVLGVDQIPPFATSVAAKSWISGLDFVVSGRMHACIAAYSSGVPVLPIAYSRKFNGLFETLRYPHFVDGRVATSEEAVATIIEAFDRREVLKTAIDAGASIYRERLAAYTDRLVVLFEDLLAKRAAA